MSHIDNQMNAAHVRHTLRINPERHPVEAAELERIKAAGSAATWARQCLARSAKEWAANVAERRVVE